MIDDLSKEWDAMEDKELIPDLLAWADSIQLTSYEAASIRKSILENVTEVHKGWLERMSARIDRTISRSQRRIDQSVTLRLKLQTERIDRRLNTGS